MLWFKKKEPKVQSFEEIIRRAEENQKKIKEVNNELRTIGLKAQSTTRTLIQH